MSDEYTPKEVGRILGVSDQMVRVSLRQKAPGWDFYWYSVGTWIRIPKASFERWYQARYGKSITMKATAHKKRA